MATIGLDMLYYAPITEDENGDETYYFPDNLKEAFKLADNLAAKALFDSDTCF